MARAFLGLMVVAMLSLTGYYAYTTVGDSKSAPTIAVAETPTTLPCCQERANRCGSETTEATACPSEGKCCAGGNGGCCSEKKDGCCQDKKAE